MVSDNIFVRRATGLVREISAFQALVTTMALTNTGLSIAAAAAFLPYVWPGANIPLVFFLILPFILIHSLLYSLLAWSMPKSGGDYVWVSRLLHPAVASSVNGAFLIFSAVSNGAFINFTISYGVFSAFFSFGLITNNAGLISWSKSFFTDPFWIIIVGTILLIYSAVIVIIGTRFYLKQQLVYWIIGMAGIFATISILSLTSISQFASTFDKFFGHYTTYQSVTVLAKSNGFAWVPSTGATLGAVAYAWYLNSGYQWSGYFSGELRKVRKSMLISTIGNNILNTGIFASLMLVFSSAVGRNWLNSLSYLAYAHPSLYTIPVIVNPFLLASLLANNVLIALLINIGLIAWALILIPPLLLGWSRVAMGMSFDRILPSKLSQVNDKTHTPVNAIIVMSVLLFVGLVGSTYYGIVFALLNATLMGTIGLAISALAGAIFPFARKQLYSRSPIARYKIGAIPVVTIVGAISFVFFVFLAFDVGLNPILGGTNNPLPLVILFSFFVGSGGLYFISRAYHKWKDGIDISLSFKELPPD